MALLNIENTDPHPAWRMALFELGFRPFFLFAGISAVVLVSIWVYAFSRGTHQDLYYSGLNWHSHEMVFGYTVAVIAGFLLTAVRNWTGEQTPRGYVLAGLVLLWLAARVLPLFADVVPHGLIAVLDIAFLPALAFALAVPLLRKRQKHNLVFLLILTALTLANLAVHLQMLGITVSGSAAAIYFAISLVVLLITILGGRVIPFFTETAIPGSRCRRMNTIEVLAPAGIVLLMLLELFDAGKPVIAIAALLTAYVHGTRLFGWYQKSLWSRPLLWVLHLGYAWLVAGLVLKAVAAVGLVSPALAVHAFTTACIGTMTLGMMARVALGHTGRELRIGSPMLAAFVIANLAGVARVFLPAIMPSLYVEWIVLSGVLWMMAFSIFVIAYVGILVSPRIDGRPG